jgi:hypothetical protein
MNRVSESPIDRAIFRFKATVLKSPPGWRREQLTEFIEELEKHAEQYQSEYEQSLYVQGFADGYKIRNSKDHGKVNRIESEFIVSKQGSAVQGGKGYISRLSAPIK